MENGKIHKTRERHRRTLGQESLCKERYSKIKKKEIDKRHSKSKNMPALKGHNTKTTICSNVSCRLRKAGCRGFEGCPGYISR